MKGVTHRYAEIHGFEHFRRETHFTKYGLCRHGVHERYRAIAHQPSPACVVVGAGGKSAERVMVKPVVVVQPVLESNGRFKSRICGLHEIELIDTDNGQSTVDVRNGGLTNADTRNIRRFNQADFGNLSTAGIKRRIQICGGGPARRTATDD